MQAAITNLGKYNEGELDFTWLELPATEEELAQALSRVGIGERDEFGIRYEEWFVTDYEALLGHAAYAHLGEYPGIDELNRAAELDEALGGIEDFGELMSFCFDSGIEWLVEDIVDDDAIDGIVAAEAESGGWRRVACFLSGCDDMSADWFKIDGYGNLESLGPRDLEDLKAEAFEALL